MGVLEKIAKRRSYDTTVNGEKIKLQPMPYSEVERAEPLEGNDWAGYLLGSCLLEDDGKPTFSRETITVPGEEGQADVTRPETDLEFAKRVWAACGDITPGTFREISSAVNMISQGDFEELAKN